MATTYNSVITRDAATRSRPGFAGRMLQRYIEARQKEADRLVGDYLRNFDDVSLKGMGYSGPEIAKLRSVESRAPFVL